MDSNDLKPEEKSVQHQNDLDATMVMEDDALDIKDSGAEAIEEPIRPLGGILLAFALGIIGAYAWAYVTEFTGLNIGIVVIGISYMVARGLRFGNMQGKPAYGIINIVITAVCIVIGMILLVFRTVANEIGTNLVYIIMNFDYTYTYEILKGNLFSRSIIIYGIALVFGYRFSAD